MPRLLKSETDHRLIVCQRALTTALGMLATPKTIEHEPAPTDGAIEIGLIGIAADLAISACLYEVLGPTGIIRKDSGFYLTAAEALDSFRTTLDSKIPRLTALTHETPDPLAHLQKLKDACGNFSVIFTARACAVHGGAGLSYDVALVAAKSVADFLVTLAESSKWKPYLKQVPMIPALPKEKTLIAQELAALLGKGDKSKAGALLTGIYLVLPELTKTEPTWLNTLQKVQVAPKTHDISVLIKSLQKADVGELFKVGKGAKATAVKIVDKTDHPEALPIFIGGMKKKFDKLSDAWSGYIGTANGELEKGVLSLPPIEAIYRFAAVGTENIGLPEEETKDGMSAHSIWPFVAAALDYSGTKGPIFFLIRALKQGEIGQLLKLLDSATALSAKLKKSLGDFQPLIEAVAESKPVASSSALGRKLSVAVAARDQRRESLSETLAKRIAAGDSTSKSRYEALANEIKKADVLAAPLDQIRGSLLKLEADRFPALRLLIDAANEREDIVALTAILADGALKDVATNARKAVLEIDYSFFGPQVSK